MPSNPLSKPKFINSIEVALIYRLSGLAVPSELKPVRVSSNQEDFNPRRTNRMQGALGRANCSSIASPQVCNQIGSLLEF